MAQDSSLTGFWDVRYRDGVTPGKGAHERRGAGFFQRLPQGRVLIPGCGSAGDLPLLLDCGHQVLAVDFSEAAVAIAQAQWPQAAASIRQADYFALAEDKPLMRCLNGRFCARCRRGCMPITPAKWRGC